MIVLLVVVAGVVALELSGSKSTTSSTTTSSTSTTSSSSSTTTSAASTGSAYDLSSPIGVTFDQANGNLYVTDNATGTVSVINIASDKLVTTIPVGVGPAQIAIDPTNGYLYVTNNASSTVSVIDGASNQVIKTIDTAGTRPDGIAFDPKNNCLYVAEHGIAIFEAGGSGSDISIINATTNTLIRGITGINTPTGVAYDSDNGLVYVTTAGSSVEVVDPANNTMITQINVQLIPRGIAYDPDNGLIYVGNFVSGTVSVINGSTNTVIANPGDGVSHSSPYLMGYNSGKKLVMVSNNTSKGVNVFNATSNTFLETVNLGVVGPTGMAYDPVNGVMYVAAFDLNAIYAISPSLTVSYFAAPAGAVVTSSTSSTSTLNLGG